MNIHTKRCQECNFDKGFQSFPKGENVCKRCVQDKETILWETNKIVTWQTCLHCSKHKNKITDFYIGASGLHIGVCILCTAKKASKRYLKGRSYLRHSRGCNNGFDFDGKRWCVGCETIQDRGQFDCKKIHCRECRGLPPKRKREKRNHKVEFKPMSDLELADRENRKLKRELKQEKFLERFKKYENIIIEEAMKKIA